MAEIDTSRILTEAEKELNDHFWFDKESQPSPQLVIAHAQNMLLARLVDVFEAKAAKEKNDAIGPFIPG